MHFKNLFAHVFLVKQAGQVQYVFSNHDKFTSYVCL